MISQGRRIVRISNSEGARRLLWEAAEAVGVTLVMRSQGMGWCPLRVRSEGWLHGYGETVERLQGYDHLNVDLQGTEVQCLRARHVLGELEQAAWGEVG